MNTCKTCKHWEFPPDHVGKDGVGGACTSGKFIDGSYPSKITPQDGIVFRDYEGYGAVLWTGPDFGCIHHEAT